MKVCDLVQRLLKMPREADIRIRISEGSGFGEWSNSENELYAIYSFDKPNVVILSVRNWYSTLSEVEKLIYMEAHPEADLP